MISDVFELVRKNLKNLIRAKTGSLVVILGPLLIIFLAGLAFDHSNVYKVKIGTYRPDVNDVTTNFLDQLRKEFKVFEYDSQEKCVDAIKNTDINACMVFNPDFTLGMPARNQITFYVDYSRVNLVWTIMQAMTQEVGNQTLQASLNFTKVLLDTIDYTHQRLGDERKSIVKLTTQNDLMLKNVQDLGADLGDIDLTFNDKDFAVSNLTSSKTQLKQWTESVIALGDKGLSKAITFIDAADALVKQSSVSTDSKNKLIEAFQKNVEDIKKIKEDMTEAKNLTQKSFANFDAQINAITKGISETKNKLQEADTSRQLSIRVLDAVKGLLDKSLLSISEVQQAVNDIENKIDSIEIKDAGSITQPIVTTIKPVAQEKTYLNYLFPVLIVLIIMFTALLITPTLVLLDKNSPASFRNYMTPVTDVSYVLAAFVTASIILLLQVVVILAIASIFFSDKVVTNAPLAIFILLIINSLFILIGMIIGYLFDSEETATLAGVTVGAIFLFISDVIIPLESMPEAFAYIASFNPYVLSSTLLRRVLIFNQSFSSIYGDVLIMIGYILAAALLAAGSYLIMRRYSLQQLTRQLTPVFARVRLRKK